VQVGAASSRSADDSGAARVMADRPGADQLSGGRVRIPTGELYAALGRLTGEQMVEEAVVNGRSRFCAERAARFRNSGRSRLDTNIA
jgi:hypothetical protein